jgi:hypothetical protein
MKKDAKKRVVNKRQRCKKDDMKKMCGREHIGRHCYGLTIGLFGFRY